MQRFSRKACRTPSRWNNAHGPVHYGQPEPNTAKLKDPMELISEIAMRLKAWPRHPRRLRCSREFAWNDGDIMLSSPELSPRLTAGYRRPNPPCFPLCHVEGRFARGCRGRLRCERIRRRSRRRRLETNGKHRFGVLASRPRSCLARACDAWNFGREHLGRNKSPRLNHRQAGAKAPLQQRDIARL